MGLTHHWACNLWLEINRNPAISRASLLGRFRLQAIGRPPIGDLARFLKQPHTSSLHDGRLWECGVAVHLTVTEATKGKWRHL